MRIWTTADHCPHFDMPRLSWAVAVLLLAAGLYAFAGRVAAQGTYYADLNAAVPGLANELVEDDRLTGKKVLVNVHDFFEERTGRSLPLSVTLRQRFRAELSVRGVEVFALPKGSEDEMIIVQGVWRELPEPGIRPESRKIDLVVSLIELTESGHRVLLAAQSRIDAVDDGLLTPDLDSWGRHLVRELERRAGGRGRGVFHVGEIHLDGVAEPERLRKYLVRRWLFPAFSQSRLFRLAAGGGEGSGGVLEMDVFVHAGQVEIALTASDRGGVQVASANVKVAKSLIPSLDPVSCSEICDSYDNVELGKLADGPGTVFQCNSNSRFVCRHQNNRLEEIVWGSRGWSSEDRVRIFYKTRVRPDNYAALSINGESFPGNGRVYGCKYNSLALKCCREECK